MLSEVNPAASYKSVVEQATEWLSLVKAEELNDFSSRSYSEQILILRNRAVAQGKQLVVRDWTTINFLPGSASANCTPSGQLEQRVYLNRAGFEPIPLVITREGAAVYSSWKHNFPHVQGLEREIFAKSYLEYACAVREFPRIHLEDLRTQPEMTLIKILDQFKLDTRECSFLLQKFSDFRKCTGNVTLRQLNESASATQILPPEINVVKLASFADIHPALAEANKVFGYE